VVKNYYADGNLESVVPCKDGKLNGVAVWYYSHGKKCLEITYKDGLKNGEMTRFYRNGQKETVEYYKNDSLNETSLKYNEKGVLISEIAYRDGKKNGVIKQYYPDGSLFLRGNYVNDQYDGTWEYFDVEGFKVGEGLFDKGDGILTGYDDMENITRKVYYKNSIMYKEEMYSTKTKQIEKIVTYKDDRIADIQIIDNQTAKK
jgi:antitoxin component YwqK of YwqJK toxin-antitoxin module